MASTIKLDDEFRFLAREVRDEGTNRNLSSELCAAQSPVPQPEPQAIFRLGLRPAQ
jgi:hypothetical protein